MENGSQAGDVRVRVLRELRDDGRASYTRIADKLGIPRHQVAQLVQSALDQGELRLTVSISPDLLGLERFAYLQVSVDGPVAPVRDTLVAMAETTFVADIAGPYPIEVEIRVGPDPHLRNTLDRVVQIPGVRDLRTHLYESVEVNRYSPLRTGRTGFQIDEADRAIVQHLQRDCRASFRELGEAAGLSASGARLRFERLVRHGALKVVGIPVRSGRSGTPTLGVGIRTGGPVATLLPKITALDPEFLAVTVGGYDFIATISADTASDLLATMDALRALEDITTIDSWANLQIAKEQYGQGDRLAAHPQRLQGPGTSLSRQVTVPELSGRTQRRQHREADPRPPITRTAPRP